MGELVCPEEGRDQMRRQARRRQRSVSAAAVGQRRSSVGDLGCSPKILPGGR